MTKLGYVKRMSADNFRAQHRGGRGIRGMDTIDDDYIEELFMTTSHHYLLFFTNFGRVYRMKAYEIPEAGRTARGTAIINLLQLAPEEKITAVIPIKDYKDADHQYLFMATKNGLVKKTRIQEYANIRKTGLQAITLREDDELIEVKTTNGQKELFLVTKNGMCIRFHEKDVRATGRNSMGVIGMTMTDDDEVVAMQMDTQGSYLLTVSENGLGKLTDIGEFQRQRRGGKGVKCYKITEKTGSVVGAKIVKDDQEIMIINTEGIVIRMMVNDISKLGRIASGVKLIDLNSEKEKVASIAKVRESSSQAGEEKMIHDMEEELQEEKEAGASDFDEAIIRAENARDSEDGDSDEQIEKLIERALSDAGETVDED